MKKVFFSLMIFLLVFISYSPVVSINSHIIFAQEKAGGGNAPESAGGGSAEVASGNIQLANPLGSIKDIPSLVKQILEIAMKIGVPLIVLAIIYTGYLFIAAQGAPDKLTAAKESLVYVVIGAAILLGAYVIAEAIVGTVNAIRGV